MAVVRRGLHNGGQAPETHLLHLGTPRRAREFLLDLYQRAVPQGLLSILLPGHIKGVLGVSSVMSKLMGLELQTASEE